MKHELGTGWSARERATGERTAKAWEKFFAAEPGVTATAELGLTSSRIAEVRARHEADLMRRANVVGVAEGVRRRKGKITGQVCLVVYVERKVPRSQLNRKDLIPRQIDGVPLDVVEVGRITPLPA